MFVRGAILISIYSKYIVVFLYFPDTLYIRVFRILEGQHVRVEYLVYATLGGKMKTSGQVQLVFRG